METLDRYLQAVTLIFALTIYAVVSAGVTFKASPREASLSAAVEHTPVVVGLRLELRRGCLALAVLAQLNEERRVSARRPGSAESLPSIDESTPFSLLCRLDQGTRRPRID
jgi:hypothetical protein